MQVGLAGPLGLLRQHELRDYAQRLPDCHDYLRHGRSAWVDAWWQLNCDLRLADEPQVHIEARIADDRFYRFLERTWMLQQLPVAVLLFCWGGWSFVYFGTCARVTAWWVLCVMRCTGLAWKLKLPTDLPSRPELLRLDRVSGAIDPKGKPDFRLS